MTLYWHDVDVYESPTAALATLDALGVRMGPMLNRPMVYFWDADANSVLVNIGSLKATKDGEITIRPRSDCAGRYLQLLVGSASQAFRVGREGRTGWTYYRRNGGFWWADQLVRPPEGDVVGQAVRAARARHTSELRAENTSVRVTEDWTLQPLHVSAP